MNDGAIKKEIENAGNKEELRVIELRYLGRKQGRITLRLRKIKELPEGERKKEGAALNHLCGEIEEAIEKKRHALNQRHEIDFSGKHFDISLPPHHAKNGLPRSRGHLHPLTLMRREVETIFSSMGFAVVEGPLVETEYYNFDALNLPPNHPARDFWDTFWLQDPKRSGEKWSVPNEGRLKKALPTTHLLLRTHISPMQVRFMEKNNPPLRFISPGKVFRYEATDTSHDVEFMYVEGLMVDKNVSVAHMKYILFTFLQKLFSNKSMEMRLRPSYFPFVEPGFEVDMRLAESSKWLEILGAGMVHQQVFKNVGYIPKQWQGFAFGMGLDRLAMLKYKIPDIRLFHAHDIKFLEQF